MYSIRGQHENVSEKLIIAGSDVSIKDKSGKTPLQMAEEANCLKTANLISRYLIAADPNDPFLKVLTCYLEKVEAASCCGVRHPEVIMQY